MKLCISFHSVPAAIAICSLGFGECFFFHPVLKNTRSRTVRMCSVGTAPRTDVKNPLLLVGEYVATHIVDHSVIGLMDKL